MREKSKHKLRKEMSDSETDDEPLIFYKQIKCRYCPKNYPTEKALYVHNVNHLTLQIEKLPIPAAKADDNHDVEKTNTKKAEQNVNKTSNIRALLDAIVPDEQESEEALKDLRENEKEEVQRSKEPSPKKKVIEVNGLTFEAWDEDLTATLQEEIMLPTDVKIEQEIGENHDEILDTTESTIHELNPENTGKQPEFMKQIVSSCSITLNPLLTNELITKSDPLSIENLKLNNQTASTKNPNVLSNFIATCAVALTPVVSDAPDPFANLEPNTCKKKTTPRTKLPKNKNVTLTVNDIISQCISKGVNNEGTPTLLTSSSTERSIVKRQPLKKKAAQINDNIKLAQPCQNNEEDIDAQTRIRFGEMKNVSSILRDTPNHVPPMKKNRLTKKPLPVPITQTISVDEIVTTFRNTTKTVPKKIPIDSFPIQRTISISSDESNSASNLSWTSNKTGSVNISKDPTSEINESTNVPGFNHSPSLVSWTSNCECRNISKEPISDNQGSTNVHKCNHSPPCFGNSVSWISTSTGLGRNSKYPTSDINGSKNVPQFLEKPGTSTTASNKKAVSKRRRKTSPIKPSNIVTATNIAENTISASENNSLLSFLLNQAQKPIVGREIIKPYIQKPTLEASSDSNSRPKQNNEEMFKYDSRLEPNKSESNSLNKIEINKKVKRVDLNRFDTKCMLSGGVPVIISKEENVMPTRYSMLIKKSMLHCKYCNRFATSWFDLIQHKLSHLSVPLKRMEKCKQCGKNYPTEEGLRFCVRCYPFDTYAKKVADVKPQIMDKEKPVKITKVNTEIDDLGISKGVRAVRLPKLNRFPVELQQYCENCFLFGCLPKKCNIPGCKYEYTCVGNAKYSNKHYTCEKCGDNFTSIMFVRRYIRKARARKRKTSLDMVARLLKLATKLARLKV